MRVVRHLSFVLLWVSVAWPVLAAGSGAPGAAPAAVPAAAPTPTRAPQAAVAKTSVPAPPTANPGGNPAQAPSLNPPGPPFELADVYYFEPATGTKYVARPGNFFIPIVDTLKTWSVSFLFYSNVPRQEIAEIVEKRVCCAALLINGQSVAVSSLAFSGDKVFVRATVPDMQTWPKTVQLRMYHSGITASPSDASRASSPAAPPSGVSQLQAPAPSLRGASSAPVLRPFMDYKSKLTTVQALSPRVSYFAKNLYATFSHARCTDCHSMGDSNAVRAQHEAGGVFNVDVRQPHVMNCGGTSCHVQVKDWRTPPFSLGINWKGKGPKEICGIVTSHLPSAERLHTHFHDDPRVVWAVSSGWVPPPSTKGSLPTAPPHNAPEWLHLVDTWINGGFPCPQ